MLLTSFTTLQMKSMTTGHPPGLDNWGGWWEEARSGVPRLRWVDQEAWGATSGLVGWGWLLWFPLLKGKERSGHVRVGWSLDATTAWRGDCCRPCTMMVSTWTCCKSYWNSSIVMARAIGTSTTFKFWWSWLGSTSSIEIFERVANGIIEAFLFFILRLANDWKLDTLEMGQELSLAPTYCCRGAKLA